MMRLTEHLCAHIAVHLVKQQDAPDMARCATGIIPDSVQADVQEFS